MHRKRNICISWQEISDIGRFVLSNFLWSKFRTSLHQESDKPHVSIMSALFEIIAWTLTITALSGNSFVIFLILFRKNLRLRKLNWYIISLAVADALVALSFYPPLFFCDRWSFCQTSIMRAFRWIFIYSSVCNLCAMTADRYLAITKPMYHRVKVSAGLWPFRSRFHGFFLLFCVVLSSLPFIFCIGGKHSSTFFLW